MDKCHEIRYKVEIIDLSKGIHWKDEAQTEWGGTDWLTKLDWLNEATSLKVLENEKP